MATTNPFDISTNTPAVTPATPTATNLQNAVNSTAAPDVTGYTASTAGASGYDPTLANAGAATSGTASTVNWQPSNASTVQGQLGGILSSGNPLLEQARTQAAQGMNAKGLLNSSMALGAGENAMIASALPIAQQDAQTNSTAGQLNTQQSNAMNQFNTGAANAVSQFNTGAQNTANLNNAQSANQAESQLAAAKNTAALANAQSQNQAATFSAGAANTGSLNYASQLNTQVNNQLTQAAAASSANADNATKINIQNISTSTQRELATIESTYKNQLQASASASATYAQYATNVANIMANPNLSATPTPATVDSSGKTIPEGPSPMQAAVNAQVESLQNAMALLSATSGITGLSNLVTTNPTP